jgi:hypothetical protein
MMHEFLSSYKIYIPAGKTSIMKTLHLKAIRQVYLLFQSANIYNIIQYCKCIVPQSISS